MVEFLHGLRLKSYSIILKLGYSNGITSQFGSTFVFLLVDIAIFMFMNMCFCLLCCLAYRYSVAFPPTDEYFFAKMRNIKILLALVYCVIITPVWVIILFSGVDPAILRAKLENEVRYKRIRTPPSLSESRGHNISVRW
jgi:hypothetical protein